MSRRIAELLEEQPAGAGGAAREARARHVGRDRRGELPRARSSSSRARREAIERAGDGRFGLGGRQVAPSSGRTSATALLVATLPALRGALLADADGVVLEVDRSPEAVAFASSARAPEVSQVGAPCPDHLINTKHKPLVVDFDPDTDDAGRARASAFARGVEEYARWYRALLRAQPRRRDAAVPDRPRRAARRARPRRRHRHDAARDAGRARIARDLYHRAIAVEDAADALGGFRSLSEAEAFAIEYWPLERYKLAQAPPRGELAGRDRAGHRRGQRHRPRDRARARRARRARRRRRPERATARSEVADELVAAHGVAPRARGRRSTSPSEDGRARDGAPDGARVRRPRHPRRVGRARDERADHRDDARRLGAELRRARPRLLPRRARGVPRPDRAGPRRLDRLRRLEERARRGGERRRVLVGEGGVAPPRALPRRGGRPARDPRQHRQPGRGDPGLEHLVVRLEGRAREHLRRQRGRAPDLLPRPHEARRRRLPEDVAEAIAFFAGPRSRSRPETSSTSTAASPPRIPGSAKEAHRPLVSFPTTPTRKEPSMHKHRWAVFAAAFLVAGVAVAAALGRPEPLDGGQDVLLHPEGHAQPVRGDRRPRRQDRAHRARRQAGRPVGHGGHRGGAAAGDPGGDPGARGGHRDRRQRPGRALPGAQAGAGGRARRSSRSTRT